MEKKTLGAFIALLRKEKGLTQKQLAELLNVSDKTVSHWECDETSPDISVLTTLAEILGVSVDELLRGEKREAQPTVEHHYIPPKSESVFDKAGNFASKTFNKIKNGMASDIAERYRYFRMLSLIGTVIGCVVLLSVVLTNLLTGQFFHPSIGFVPGIVTLIGSMWTIAISLGFTIGARCLFSNDILPQGIDETEREYTYRANRLSFNNIFLVFCVFPMALTGIDVFPVFSNILIALVFIVIARIVFKVILVRKGILKRNEKELLIIKYGSICVALIALGTVVGLFFQEVWHPTPENIIFDNAGDFVAYMETPKEKPADAYLIDGVEVTYFPTTMIPTTQQHSDGSPVAELPSEDEYEEIGESSMGLCGDEFVTFKWLNQEVYDCTYNEEQGTFHVITYEAKIKAERQLDLRDDWLSVILPLYYVPVVAVCFMLYRRKVKATVKNRQ